MANRLIHRLLVYLALSAYSVTALWGQGLHELLDCHHHGFASCSNHQDGFCDDDDFSFDLAVVGARIRNNGDDDCIDDDDCAICQFHAQGQLTSLDAPAISGVQIVARLIVARGPTVQFVGLRAFYSRGPPQASTTA